MSSLVRSEARGAVQWLIIDREAKRNAINREVMEALGAGLRAAEADPAIRAIVLTGAGDKAFCAGGDLAPTADGAPFAVDWADPRNFVVNFFKIVETCGKPIIGRVNGHALAGGLGLLCACDLAVAAEHAKFGTPEAKVGLYPMMILPYMLRILPRRRLMEFCITGELFTAAEALDFGLVNYVAPAGELDAKLDWLLARVLDKSPTGVRLGKMAMRALQDMTLPQAFEYAQLMLPAMAQTQDAREGFQAFNEKRPPRFKGK